MGFCVITGAAFCASASLWELKGHCFGLTNHEKSSITAEMQRPPMHHSVSSKDELGWKNVFVLLVLVLVGVIGCSQNG